MNLVVKDENGSTYHLIEKIGSGGQGAVFKVRDNDAIVVKVLYDHNSEEIIQNETLYESYRKTIRDIISIGEFNYLAIPLVMLEKPFCGYVMLFMTGLQPIANLMLPYVYKEKDHIILKKDYSSKKNRFLAKTKSESMFSYNHSGGLAKRLRVLARLAQILESISTHSAVYCDLSPSNIYISKSVSSFEVWLIDLDNLRFTSNSKKAIGTPKFIAPEVVKGNPNTIESDVYSFALIAYQLLTLAEPFNGNMIDEYGSWESNQEDDQAFENAIANGEVPWIWEIKDSRNRSEKGFNPNILLTKELFHLFERTFNEEGRTTPTQRPQISEWYDALTLAFESLIQGELCFNEEGFKDLIPSKGKTYFQKVSYLNRINPFSDQQGSKRIKVTINQLVSLEDEEGNQELLAIPDKTIFWSAESMTGSYFLSNFDICKRRPEKYVHNTITLLRQEKLFSTSNQFRVLSSNPDLEIKIIEDNCIVEEILNLTKATIYIKESGIYSKKITMEMED